MVFSSIFALLSPGICAYLLLFTLVGGFFVSLASPGGLRFDSSSFGAFSRRKNGRLEPFFLAPFLLPISLCSETLFAPFFFLDFGVPRFSLGLALAAAQKRSRSTPRPSFPRSAFFFLGLRSILSGVSLCENGKRAVVEAIRGGLRSFSRPRARARILIYKKAVFG